MFYWEKDRQLTDFMEKIYRQFVESSSFIGSSIRCILRWVFSSLSKANLSSVCHPFGSYDEDTIEGFLCSVEDEDLGALSVSLVVVLLWVISFKMYIDSMNEHITGAMLTQTTSSLSWSDQASQFIYGILYCVWDTLELVWDVILEILAKFVQFLIVIFNVVFQILIFTRDLCIETMQTFANLFQGIINVISSISCDDIEDFASACIVVLLWIGAIKILVNMLGKNPGVIQFDDSSEKSNSFYDGELEADKCFDSDGCPQKLRKRKKAYKRQERSRPLQRVARISEPDDGEPSD